MTTDSAPQVLVCARETELSHGTSRLLHGAGYQVVKHVFPSSEAEAVRDARLVIIDGSGHHEAALDFCRRLRSRWDEAVVPIIFISQEAAPAARLAGFDAGADAYLLHPFIPAELLAQARALLRTKEIHDRLAEKTAEIHRINTRLQHAYQQIDQELQLAQRIQESFLPQSLPAVDGTRFAVKYLLCGRVGGDFYDVFRLDEDHIGFYVADAMGHGVPASLLTIFVKMGIRTKEVFGSQYRLVPPAEVIQRLNQELIDQNLSENPFITMLYGLYNHSQGRLEIARAGHPYPLYVPREGPLQWWQHHGLLLGVAAAPFTSTVHWLQPGDKVLFYSDGVEAADSEAGARSGGHLMACAQLHRRNAANVFVENLARDLLAKNAHHDDLTLLAVERTA